MAKPKKERGAASERSVLQVAFEAYQRGDAVLARRLANEVLAGKVGPDEQAAAERLASELEVEPSIQVVAKDIASRTVVPPKPYVFVAAAAAAFVTLVVIAAVRY